MNDAGLLVGLLALVGLVVVYLQLRSATTDLRRSEAERVSAEQQIETRARDLLKAWQQNELAAIRGQQAELATREARTQLETWRLTEEKAIRQDAALRSQSITRGKVAEQFVPYLPEFGYNAKDAKFIGSPIDFVVFDGLSDGTVKEIVIVEIKTGSSALTAREKQVKQAVESGRIRWREIRLETAEVLESHRSEVPTGQGIPITVPLLGDGPTQEAVLNRWLVANGARVSSGQPLYELETEKVVAEIPSPGAGELSITADEGAAVSVGDLIGLLRSGKTV